MNKNIRRFSLATLRAREMARFELNQRSVVSYRYWQRRVCLPG
jgi:hypothetical protein